MAEDLPAVAEILSRHLLHYHKTPELVVRHLSMSDGSEVGTTINSKICCLPRIFNVEHHEDFAYHEEPLSLGRDLLELF